MNLKHIVVYRKAKLMTKAANVVNLSPAPGLPAVYGTIEEATDQLNKMEAKSKKKKDKPSKGAKRLAKKIKKITKKEAAKRRKAKRDKKRSDAHQHVVRLLGRKELDRMAKTYSAHAEKTPSTQVLVVPDVELLRLNFSTTACQLKSDTAMAYTHVGPSVAMYMPHDLVILCSLVASKVMLRVVALKKKERVRIISEVFKVRKPNTMLVEDAIQITEGLMRCWNDADGPYRMRDLLNKRRQKLFKGKTNGRGN